ncbi:MAG TPA: YraN family protein [Paraburkholderia sp.]|nr:YraN family protein [Paraburkholderia sp.]
MRLKTQTDRTRPTLCHAGDRDPGATRTKQCDGATNATSTAHPTTNRDNFSKPAGSKLVGAAFEARAMEFLQRQRLRFVARNVACRGGEIDLIMRDRDGALVFVEVRARAQRRYGGAAASIGWQKRQRIVRAARHYLAIRGRQSREEPACRFDVIAFDAGRLVWLRDAFRADEV